MGVAMKFPDGSKSRYKIIPGTWYPHRNVYSILCLFFRIVKQSTFMS